MDGHRPDRATLTVEEVAARLGISRTLAYALARAGRLPTPAFRLGRRLVVSRLALERVLNGEPVQERGDGDDVA